MLISDLWQVPLWSLAVVATDKSLNTTTGSGKQFNINLASVFIFMFAICLLATSIALTAGGGGQWLKYSRKRLRIILINHQNGLPYPKTITKSQLFKRKLKLEIRRKE